MNTKEYKEKLLSEREQLVSSLNEIGREIEQKKDWVVKIENGDEEHTDPLDDAEISEELERHVGELEVLEKQYKEVNDALARIEKGAYGICEVCGEKIDEERLHANPSARTCKEHMNESPKSE